MQEGVQEGVQEGFSCTRRGVPVGFLGHFLARKRAGFLCRKGVPVGFLWHFLCTS